jgi:hypothetical protein
MKLWGGSSDLRESELLLQLRASPQGLSGEARLGRLVGTQT